MDLTYEQIEELKGTEVMLLDILHDRRRRVRVLGPTWVNRDCQLALRFTYAKGTRSDYIETDAIVDLTPCK